MRDLIITSQCSEPLPLMSLTGNYTDIVLEHGKPLRVPAFAWRYQLERNEAIIFQYNLGRILVTEAEGKLSKEDRRAARDKRRAERRAKKAEDGQ